MDEAAKATAVAATEINERMVMPRFPMFFDDASAPSRGRRQPGVFTSDASSGLSELRRRASEFATRSDTAARWFVRGVLPDRHPLFRRQEQLIARLDPEGRVPGIHEEALVASESDGRAPRRLAAISFDNSSPETIRAGQSLPGE